MLPPQEAPSLPLLNLRLGPLQCFEELARAHWLCQVSHSEGAAAPPDLESTKGEVEMKRLAGDSLINRSGIHKSLIAIIVNPSQRISLFDPFVINLVFAFIAPTIDVRTIVPENANRFFVATNLNPISALVFVSSAVPISPFGTVSWRRNCHREGNDRSLKGAY